MPILRNLPWYVNFVCYEVSIILNFLGGVDQSVPIFPHFAGPKGKKIIN